MVGKIKSVSLFAFELLLTAGREYGVDRSSRMAAALAYRTFFALAPMLFVAFWVFGRFLGSAQEAQQEIYDAIETFAGIEVANAVQTLLDSIVIDSGTAAFIGFVLLLWTVSSLFQEVQHDMNDIFEVPYEHTAGMVATIRKRGIGFLWAMGLGLALVAVWAVNFSWRFFEGLFPDDLVWVHQAIEWLAPLVSLILVPILIGLLFRTMIVERIPWRALWIGSLFTSVAFLLVAHFVGLYFVWDENTSALAIVGSIFVLLLMAFSLAGVFLYGVVVTKVYVDYLAEGDIMQPSERVRSIDTPDVVVGEPAQALPNAAVVGFLGGLLVGWRKSKR